MLKQAELHWPAPFGRPIVHHKQCCRDSCVESLAHAARAQLLYCYGVQTNNELTDSYAGKGTNSTKWADWAPRQACSNVELNRDCAVSGRQFPSAADTPVNACVDQVLADWELTNVTTIGQVGGREGEEGFVTSRSNGSLRL